MQAEIGTNNDLGPVMMMCGISGSGKTMYARRLSSMGYTMISADRMAWEKYGDKLTQLPSEEMHRTFSEVNKRIDQLLTEAIAKGERVVVDSTLCRRERRAQMVELCRSRGIEPLIIYLSAPYEVLSQRLTARNGSGPDDQIITEHQLRHFCAHFEAPGPDEPCLTVHQKP